MKGKDMSVGIARIGVGPHGGPVDICNVMSGAAANRFHSPKTIAPSSGRRVSLKHPFREEMDSILAGHPFTYIDRVFVADLYFTAAGEVVIMVEIAPVNGEWQPREASLMTRLALEDAISRRVIKLFDA